MTQKEFTALPELLTRAKVVECGVPAGSVDDMRVELKAPTDVVTFGQIGAVRLPGRGCKNKAKAKFKYRKTDVAGIVGYKV